MSNYEDNFYSSDSDQDSIKELVLDDFLNNPETENILEEHFFELFKNKMSNKMENFYKEEVEFATNNYMDILDKDFEIKNSYDFFLTIYPFIDKQYDISIFEKFPILASPLFIKKDEKKTTKKENKDIVNSKKYDWGTKKYK